MIIERSGEAVTRREMDELIDRHFRAEELSDPDGAVAGFTEDVLHEVAGTHRLYGRDAARVFYVGLFATLRLTRVTSERRLHGRSFAIDEALVDAVTQDGEPTAFRLLHVFEFANGRISRESAWQAPLHQGPALTERWMPANSTATTHDRDSAS